jgi:transposase
MAATKTFANGKPKGISLLSERQQQMVLESKDADGRWRISPELLAVQFGVSTVTIYNVLRRAKKKKAPTPCTSSGRDPLEADQTSYCHSDDTASLTKTEEGI